MANAFVCWFTRFLRSNRIFVNSVSDYGADFIMFPEFFNSPLMSPYNHLKEIEAMHQLATMTDDIVKKFRISQLHIISILSVVRCHI